MECPSCRARLRRLRTRDIGRSVKRYNVCTGCGIRIKTIELYLVDYDRGQNELIRRAVSAERQAEQLSLNLDTIRSAFQHLHDAVTPLQEFEAGQETASSLPGRYTRTWRNRQAIP